MIAVLIRFVTSVSSWVSVSGLVAESARQHREKASPSTRMHPLLFPPDYYLIKPFSGAASALAYRGLVRLRLVPISVYQ